jgi:hypothetical protein
VLWIPIALAAALGGAPHAGRAATILYQPGYELIAGPTGTTVNGVAGSLYTIDPASGQLIAVDASRPLQGGVGYFADFTDLTNVRLAPDDGKPAIIQAPGGEWLLVGNPSDYNDATVQGADLVYGYDPQAGYVQESTVPPGQGALVYSASGGTIVVRPLPNGIDAQLGAAEDKLIDTALPLSALPSGWTMSAANTSYGQNANEPNVYVVQYHPRQNPKANAPLQTNFVSITLISCKDADFAAQLVAGANSGVVNQLYGANTANIQSLPAPAGIGQQAVEFYVTTQNGTNKAGHYVLYFQEGIIVVMMQTNEPLNRDEASFLLGLAQQQDARIQSAYPASS